MGLGRLPRCHNLELALLAAARPPLRNCAEPILERANHIAEEQVDMRGRVVVANVQRAAQQVRAAEDAAQGRHAQGECPSAERKHKSRHVRERNVDDWPGHRVLAGAKIAGLRAGQRQGGLALADDARQRCGHTLVRAWVPELAAVATAPDKHLARACERNTKLRTSGNLGDGRLAQGGDDARIALVHARPVPELAVAARAPGRDLAGLRKGQRVVRPARQLNDRAGGEWHLERVQVRLQVALAAGAPAEVRCMLGPLPALHDALADRHDDRVVRTACNHAHWISFQRFDALGHRLPRRASMPKLPAQAAAKRVQRSLRCQQRGVCRAGSSLDDVVVRKRAQRRWRDDIAQAGQAKLAVRSALL
eukprot:m.103729 g.103729  ORF g.103729 m.103729 type:complete len:364 (-) comp8866_c0_seq1:2985-4076(-)